MSDLNGRPPVKLTPEAKTQLEGLDTDIKRAEKYLKLMKEMGMDVTDLEAELKRHTQIRKIMLDEFS